MENDNRGVTLTASGIERINEKVKGMTQEAISWRVAEKQSSFSPNTYRKIMNQKPVDLSGIKRLFRAFGLEPQPGIDYNLPNLTASKPEPRASASAEIKSSPPKPLHNLPVDERDFVGRKVDVEAVLNLFRKKNAKLVTITGMGGMGKTFLSRQIARELLQDFPDGVWLVECEALTQPEEILAAICNALSFDPTQDSHEKALQSYLSERAILLLLDCFEHLKNHAHVVDRLLAASPRLRCLVTSRQSLNLNREFQHQLEPMSTNRANQIECDSVILFAEAATHVEPTFAISEINHEIVSQICERLEGVPLAIVLAAGQLKYRTLSELQAELGLELLSDNSSGQGGRRDYRRVIKDSFRLLDQADLRTLCLMSVFTGGCHLKDAEECLPKASYSLAHSIGRLCDSSLLRAETLNDKKRFRILDVVREYLQESDLGTESEEELEICRARHASRYCDVARSVGELMLEGRWTQGMTTLRVELGNFRAALDFCMKNRLHSLVASFFDALARTHFETGLWSDFTSLSKASEIAATELKEPKLMMRILGLEGAFARRFGKNDRAVDCWQRRLELAKEQNEEQIQVDALCDLALLSIDLLELPLAKSRLQIAMTLALVMKDYGLLASIHSLEARIAIAETNHDNARYHVEIASELLKSVEDKDTVIYTGKMLGLIYKKIGDNINAEGILKLVISTAVEGDRVFAVGLALIEIGELYERQQNFLLAGMAYCGANQIHTEISSQLKASTQRRYELFISERDASTQSEMTEFSHLSWQDIARKIALPEATPSRMN